MNEFGYFFRHSHVESPPRSPAQSRNPGKPDIDEVFDHSNISEAELRPPERAGDQKPPHGMIAVI